MADFSKYAAPQASGGGDFSKYGAVVAPPQQTQKRAFPRLFGNPVEDIKKAGAAVHDAISGQGEFVGQNPIRRGFSAVEDAALAIPTTIADVIPGGRQALDASSRIFDFGIRTAGSIPFHVVDAAVKAGVMTPEQKDQFSKNAAAFANSPLGHALESTASVANSAGNIANVILAADGAARGTQAILEKVNEQPAPAAPKPEPVPEAQPQNPKQQQAITDTTAELKKIEDKYAPTRKANDYAKDGGQASRERIAASGVLRYAVDEGGRLRTNEQGGAVDQYRAMTLGPAEGVVRTALEQEGSQVNLSDVSSELLKQVKESGLHGADLITAMNNIEREIEGLRTYADEKGYVPTAILQDAKIGTTRNINYQTPPEVSTYRKAVARAYKSLIEDHSSFNVREVNAELQKFYDDLDRLERLDGRIVEGGKLGRYAAQAGGSLVGMALGSLLGPIGAAAGTIAGGEVAGAIKSSAFRKTLDKGVVPQPPASPVLEEAVSRTASEGGIPSTEPQAQ